MCPTDLRNICQISRKVKGVPILKESNLANYFILEWRSIGRKKWTKDGIPEYTDFVIISDTV